MNRLILFSNAFPYGNWEAYLETEVKYYDSFDEVVIFSLQTRKNHLKVKRKLSNKFKVFPIIYLSRLQYFLRSIYAFTDINFYKELKKLIVSKKLSISRLITLVVFITRANYEYRRIVKLVNHNNIQLKNSIFYVYRFEYQPYVASKLREKYNLNCKIISRAHRGDLYESRRENGYIPMREYNLDVCSQVFPCSENGEKYLKESYPVFNEKISCRYLGTEDYGRSNLNTEDIFKLVSCSHVVSVKRLDRIVNALSNVKSSKIEWTHYGDGPLLDEIKALSKIKLKDNISYKFKSHVDNSELLKEYKNNNYDMFINVSSSEGLPVSIMEVISFGIPCIATDVGGTKEIVINEITGQLVNENISDSELAKIIEKYIYMDSTKMKRLRESTRLFWEENFNSKNNYTKFNIELENILKDEDKNGQ